jgi:hypothetical protein
MAVAPTWTCDDLGHDLVRAMDALSALETQRDGERQGRVGEIGVGQHGCVEVRPGIGGE